MIISLSGFFIVKSSNDQIVLADTTTTTFIDTTTTLNESIYTYNNYEELLSMLYEDVYEEAYQALYDDIMAEINQDFYDSIYSQVEDDLLDIVQQQEIDLYIDDFQQDIYDVIEIGEKSVFGVTAYLPNDQGANLGSGVVYKFDDVNNLYYIVTNNHVVEEATTFEIEFANGDTIPATLIGTDDIVDIAVLTFSSVGLENQVTVSELGDSSAITISEFVLAIGNPIGYNFYNSVTMGIVSGLDRIVDSNAYINYIQHDAAINNGNSGGPIYNLDGQVIGINVLKYSSVDIEGMGFAIPINLVKEVIYRIENDMIPNNTIVPQMGASFYSVFDVINGSQVTLDRIVNNSTQRLNITVNLPTGITSGLIVIETELGEALYNKLDGGDLIVSCDGYVVSDYDSFRDYLYDNYYAGDSMLISYYEYNYSTNSYSSLKTITVNFE
jgi:serine protease Do